MMTGRRSHRLRLGLVTTALPLVLMACDGDGSVLSLRLQGSMTAQDGLSGLRIQLLDKQLTVADFEVGTDPSVPSVPAYHTKVSSDGSLVISVELVQADSKVAEGDVRLDLRENWEWGADIFRSATDPTVGCFGCLGSEAFPIATQFQNEPGEAIWFVWGGQERGSNVVY